VVLRRLKCVVGSGDERCSTDLGRTRLPGTRINLVKVFSATKARDRDELGERVTEWLRRDPTIEVLHTVVMLSSDQRFHCLSITVFAHTSREP
jgi:hypothetical protein